MGILLAFFHCDHSKPPPPNVELLNDTAKFNAKQCGLTPSPCSERRYPLAAVSPQPLENRINATSKANAPDKPNQMHKANKLAR